MQTSERVPVLRKNGITLYGRKVNAMGKLGNYEVISEHGGHEGVFSLFSEAEDKYKYLQSLREKKNN